MNSFMKIAAMVVASAPLALIGCMGTPADDEMDQSVAQAEQSGDASQGGIKVTEVPAGSEGCLASESTAPGYTAPVIQAPGYQAPTFEAPRFAPPVFKAPEYQSPMYQASGEVPVINAPNYRAPTYAGPTFNAPVYEAPKYGAPKFEAPIFESPTYHEANDLLAPRPLTPCRIIKKALPCENP
jgi:hypothetical protein